MFTRDEAIALAEFWANAMGKPRFVYVYSQGSYAVADAATLEIWISCRDPFTITHIAFPRGYRQ